jgi:hypothetical protein
VRQIVETVYEKLAHTFRLDRERPHALSGFQARLAAKMALHTFCIWLNEQLGRPRLAFTDMEDIRALRAALNTLGDGFVEAIDDNTLRNIAQRQIELTAGRIHGEAVEVPVLEAPGQSRIGRFGWKDQHSSLLSFTGELSFV